MLAVDVGHEVLGALWQIQNGLQADDLRACCLNGRILLGEQAQIVQLLRGECAFIVHIIPPFPFDGFIIPDFSGYHKGTIVKLR